MSSADEDNTNDDNGLRSSKKRRVQRACDVCRRKKIRCDGSQMPGNRCSNCIAYNYDCSYVEAAKKRGPPKGYVESLENRLEKMEALLHRLCPDADFTQELGTPVTRANFPREGTTTTPGDTSNTPNASASVLVSGIATSSTGVGGSAGIVADIEGLDPSDDEYGETQMLLLQQSFNEMSVSYRFFGKSSGARLVQTALDLKSEYSGKTRDKFSMATRRPEFWMLHPWERSTFKFEGRKYTFPESDLMDSLIELYFTNINIYLPLLHRPTFEAALVDGLHHRDEAFGAVVCTVLANGARYSPDPRVVLEGTDSWHSSGWKWFEQLRMVRKSLLAAPCLYDLQMYSLACLFLQGCSAPQACWTMVGIGLRLAQDVGAHRRKVYGAKLSVEDELWKRAFWSLVVLDRLMSASLGRPCAIQEEDFDLDLPVECDDEYWVTEDPEQAFKQPPGKPSRTSYFVSFLKLNQILAFALRTIYSINKSKILLGFVGQQWEQHIVAELDSALNKWIDSVPDHLRWDPTRENTTFFTQSASLYSTYYHLQILVHRPFIPSPRKPSPLTFPSLAICTNAARSCAHIVDHLRRRTPGRPLPHFQLPAFTAGIVLLLNIWGVKRSGVAIDPVKEMTDVHKCMEVLKDAEGRWHAAGRLWDVLYELAFVGELPLPTPGQGPSMKRSRDADSAPSSTSPTSGDHHPQAQSKSSLFPPSTHTPATWPSIVAQSYPHVAYPINLNPVPPGALHSASAEDEASLPMHSYELGRMPQYPDGVTLPDRPPAPAATATTAPWYADGLHRLAADAPLQDASTMFAPNAPNPPAGHFPGFGYRSPGTEMFESMLQSLPPVAPPGQAQGRSPEGDIWSTVPSGYELEDWDSYITTVSGLAHPHAGSGAHPTGPGPSGA
ncbi:hypothetical protein FA95DRAFT_1601990 [Auriscalpium vulgare]|uniref:Uncharacterized protein n=1 Tax=Auriscalpium vulgare TaxID=40419 RepID=A0ACB8S6W6_9AGAM|nr:hypothetical protein FA95DRAFT_1601990 [Auriscalpium vulgare]